MKTLSATCLLIAALSFATPGAVAEEDSDQLISEMFRMLLDVMSAMVAAADDGVYYYHGDNISWQHSGCSYGRTPPDVAWNDYWNHTCYQPCPDAFCPQVHPHEDYYHYPGAAYPLIAALDGRWYGFNGVVLEVHGDWFRLWDGYIENSGHVRFWNNFVYLYSAQTGGIIRYEFMRNQHELILWDIAGHMFIFRQGPINSLYP